MEITLVLQYGRVGSISVVEALQAAEVTPVLHLHKIDEDEVVGELQSYMRDGARVPDDLTWSAAALLLSRRNLPINVITLVREPFARDLSNLCYGLTDLGRYGGPEGAAAEFTRRDATFASRWLLRNIVAFTGIDIFAEPFDRERGYSFYRRGRFRLLVMQTELENAAKETALQSFLRLSAPPVLPHANATRIAAGEHDALMAALRAMPARALRYDWQLADTFYGRERLASHLERRGMGHLLEGAPPPLG
ncbi:MAG TPA: putative capsular polysaccharide synthesis family protein [Alphaproteobacteria bacterium]|nr:putative capsular polysaccharide synthesis family protein [Alphaproteobacteria bacterium]